MHAVTFRFGVKKGMKIFCNWLGGIPEPVSLTSMAVVVLPLGELSEPTRTKTERSELLQGLLRLRFAKG